MRRWFLILVVTAACGGSKPAGDTAPAGGGDQAGASSMDAMIEQAADNSLRVDEEEHCNYFHGTSREQLVEGFRYEVQQGEDNGELKKKEYGLQCIIESKSCDDLKQCANMMD
jgi:hypothetical protein